MTSFEGLREQCLANGRAMYPAEKPGSPPDIIIFRKPVGEERHNNMRHLYAAVLHGDRRVMAKSPFWKENAHQALEGLLDVLASSAVDDSTTMALCPSGPLGGTMKT